MIALLKDMLSKDFWLKLFSFALAVLMWFTISQAISQQRDGSGSTTGILGARTTQSRILAVPVSVLSPAAQARSCRVQPETVNVTVEGDAKVIASLEPSDFQAIVDLAGISAPELNAQVKVTRPPGVAFLKAEPERVRVTFPSGN